MKTALDLISQYAEAIRGVALNAEEGGDVSDGMRALVRNATEQLRSAGDGSNPIESTRALAARLAILMASSDERQIRFRVALEQAIALLKQA